MKVGLEVLLHSPRAGPYRARLEGRRIGLVSHPAAVTQQLVGSVEALQEAGLRLTALFGPEHGFTAAALDGEVVQAGREARSGLPIYSLYGDTLQPTPEMLREVDVLVVDLQDVGARFYTFVSTLFYVLGAAGRNGCPLMLLDRPNPITGSRVNGPMLEAGWESFVGLAPTPVLHGMTLGELGRLLNDRFRLAADLTVVPLEGWRREQWFDQTGRLWIPTSPAMPRLETAVVYPGMCFLEGTNLSEGRGTSLPFEMAGAPWVDGVRLERYLRALGLPGVVFRAVHFRPWAAYPTPGNLTPTLSNGSAPLERGNPTPTFPNGSAPLEMGYAAQGNPTPTLPNGSAPLERGNPTPTFRNGKTPLERGYAAQGNLTPTLSNGSAPLERGNPTPAVVCTATLPNGKTPLGRGEVCQGVQVHVIDRESFDPLRSGLEIIAACQELWPDRFVFLPPDGDSQAAHFDRLAGSDRLRRQLQAGVPVKEIVQGGVLDRGWQAGVDEFRACCQTYLLYE